MEERRRSLDAVRRRSMDDGGSKAFSERRGSTGRRASKMADSQLLNANFNTELVRTFRRRSSITASMELGSRRNSKARGSVSMDPARRRSWSSSINKAERQRSKIRRSPMYLEFRRWVASIPDPLLGRSHRCPFTGRVHLELTRSTVEVSKELLLLQKLEQKQQSAEVRHAQKQRLLQRKQDLEKIPDFHLVDLFSEREIIGGLPNELCQELYLMKPKPLLMRTWLFHQIWDECSNEKTRLECIQEALRVPLPFRKDITPWQESYLPQMTNLSPAVSMLFMIIFMAFTQQFFALLIADVVLVFCLIVSIGWNVPHFFNYVRPLTALLRYPLYFYLFAGTVTPVDYLMKEDMVGFFGSLLVLLCVLFEIFVDLSLILTWNDRRPLQVLKDLNTDRASGSTHVYVVNAVPLKRGSMQPKFPNNGRKRNKYHEEVDEDLTAIKLEDWNADPTHMIVAEVHGLLCQLVPMQFEDYRQLTKRQAEGELLFLEYIQTNTMSSQHQTAHEVAKSIEAQKDPNLQSQYEEALRERLYKGVTWTLLPAPEGRCVKHALPVKRRPSKGYAGSNAGGPIIDMRRSSLGGGSKSVLR